MTLTIGSWFGEPGISFKVSYKVSKFIRQLLTDDIMIPFGLESKEPNTFLGLVITTLSSISELEVRGPQYDKKNKTINYGLWLPYKKINESSNYLTEYLCSLFDALVVFFNKYYIEDKKNYNQNMEILYTG